MGTLIDCDEVPGGGERQRFGFGFAPNKRLNVTITYPSGYQQHYGIGTSATGTIQFSHPVYEEGEIHYEFAEPEKPRQVGQGDRAIKAHERPTNRMAPDHVDGAGSKLLHGDPLPDHLVEAVGAKRLEAAKQTTAALASEVQAAADPAEKQRLLGRFLEAAKQAGIPEPVRDAEKVDG